MRGRVVDVPGYLVVVAMLRQIGEVDLLLREESTLEPVEPLIVLEFDDIGGGEVACLYHGDPEGAAAHRDQQHLVAGGSR